MELMLKNLFLHVTNIFYLFIEGQKTTEKKIEKKYEWQVWNPKSCRKETLNLSKCEDSSTNTKIKLKIPHPGDTESLDRCG